MHLDPTEPPPRVEPKAADAVRSILDRFAVPRRLREIGDLVWRGGHVEFIASLSKGRLDQLEDCHYALTAEWDSAAPCLPLALEPGATILGNGRRGNSGMWMRVQREYSLLVGIDVVRAPASIYVRSQRFFFLVPILNRADQAIEAGLQHALAEYSELFLRSFPTVPVARETGLRLLKMHRV